jgi:pimeloyl-ACP methyl ester carboxylesterase
MNVREGFVDVGGHRLAYLAVNEHRARPEEPAVVFIHGVLASVRFWLDAVPPAFREDRAWYALSLPAHHPSTVPADFGAEQVNERWFHRLMSGALEQLLEGRKAVVVGHSTGGFSALNLAIHHAPSVVGVVSVAGFHRGTWGGVEGLLLKLAGLGRWAGPLFELNVRIARSSRFVQRVFTTLLAHDREAFRASPLSERVLDSIRRDTRRQDPAALFALFRGIGRLEIGDRLCDIRVPCHVLAGSHDPVVPAAQSLCIASEVPGAELVVFRDVGHMPFMECTEECFGALERALADIRRRSEPTVTAPSPKGLPR